MPHEQACPMHHPPSPNVGGSGFSLMVAWLQSLQAQTLCFSYHGCYNNCISTVLRRTHSQLHGAAVDVRERKLFQNLFRKLILCVAAAAYTTMHNSLVNALTLPFRRSRGGLDRRPRRKLNLPSFARGMV